MYLRLLWRTDSPNSVAWNLNLGERTRMNPRLRRGECGSHDRGEPRIIGHMLLTAKRPARPSLAQSLLIGLVAGWVGCLGKYVAEKIYEPRTLGQTPPPLVLVQKLSGHPIAPARQGVVIQAVHYVFGGATGAIYGAAAEFAPIVTVGYGAAFGIVLQLLTHETLVPAAGLDVPASQQPAREHLSEFFSHVCYGVSAEAVRRWLRGRVARRTSNLT